MRASVRKFAGNGRSREMKASFCLLLSLLQAAHTFDGLSRIARTVGPSVTIRHAPTVAQTASTSTTGMRPAVQTSAKQSTAALLTALESHIESTRPLGRKQLGSATYSWLQREMRWLAQVGSFLPASSGSHSARAQPQNAARVPNIAGLHTAGGAGEPRVCFTSRGGSDH